MVIEIPLSKNGKYSGKDTAFVSPEDVDLSELTWTAQRDKNTTYAYRLGYIRLHWVVLERMIGRKLVKGEFADHIDGNGLNCTRGNLRLATKTQNNRNRKRGKNNTSGYKGVSWNKKNNKWRAQISYTSLSDAKKHYVSLGYFDTAEEAHKAYCEAAIKYHGEFARFE